MKMDNLNRQLLAFDLSDREEITIRGEDRATFLHGFCTNDIKKLSPGQGCEAFVTSIKGRTLGHIFVYAEEDRLVLDSVPTAADTLIPHLDRYLITEDVQLEVTTTQRSLRILLGDAADTNLIPFHEQIPDLQPNQWMPILNQPFQGQIRCLNWFDQQAFQIAVPVEATSELDRLLADLGFESGTSEQFQAVRIHQRFPTYGIDFSEENLAQEVDRTTQAISFHKGCYLGQEPVARIDALGHVNRLLRRLQIQAATPELLTHLDPQSLCGAELQRLDEPAGKMQGTITSATKISEGDHCVMEVLAIIRRDVAEPGHTLNLRPAEDFPLKAVVLE